MKATNIKSNDLHICHALAAFIFTMLFVSCADFNFNDSKQGLLEIGQISAKENCKKHINPNAYQECLNSVNENYDATYENSNR